MKLTLDSIQRTWTKTQFNTKMRLSLYARIQKMIGGGLPLIKVLDDLYLRASHHGKRPNDITAQVLMDWKTKMLNGRRFSEAISGWANDLEVMMISAGEESGDLATAFQTVIEFTKASGQIRGVVIGGATYPIMIAVMALAYMYIFGMYVIPKFAAVVDPSKWTGAARSLYIMSTVVQHWSLIAIVLIVAIVFAVGYSLPNWQGKLRIRFDAIPPYSIYRLLVGSGFLMSLAALIGAGIPVEKAMTKLSSLASPWLQERIDAAIRGLKSGLNLGDALKKSGHHFPSDEIIDDLCVYAEYGGFSTAVKRVADEWLQDGVTSVGVSMKVLNTAAMFLLAAVVMWLVAGFFGIQQEIGRMVQSAS